MKTKILKISCFPATVITILCTQRRNRQKFRIYFYHLSYIYAYNRCYTPIEVYCLFQTSFTFVTLSLYKKKKKIGKTQRSDQILQSGEI